MGTRGCLVSGFIVVLGVALATPGSAQSGGDGGRFERLAPGSVLVARAQSEPAGGVTGPQGVGDASVLGPQDGMGGAGLASPALETRPDRYAIQHGDTLWDIARRFWGDPFLWPKLWSFNPYIGNAHLIYPGNVLRLDQGSYVRPPSISLEPFTEEVEAARTEAIATTSHQEQVQESVEPATSSVTTGAAACSPHVPFLESTGKVQVRSDGFLREQGFGPLGKIAKAPQRKLLFAERDVVYLQFNRIADVSCGDVYTIYMSTRKKVSHPIYRRRVIGSLYRVLGEVEVVDINDFMATGIITASYGEISRGALLTERVPIWREVEIRDNPKEVDGYIVETLNQETTTLSKHNIVYIDRGEQDGVNVGDAFYIVRQGDGLEGLLAKGSRDITLPFQIVGKLVVSVPGEYVSEAIITEAAEVIELGDHVTTQVN